jgi:hypothetical protein
MANPQVIFYDPDSGESGFGGIDIRIQRGGASLIVMDNNDANGPTFVVDTLNRRIGHAVSGTTFTPTFDWHGQKQSDTADYAMVFDFYSATGTFNMEIQGRRARGTIGAPAALLDDDDMWEFGCYGHDGVAFSGQAAALLFEAAGAWSATSHGTRQVFKTTEQGTVAIVEVMVLGDDGCVIITGQTAGFVGAVAGEYLRVVGATRGEGSIGVFANSADTQPQSQLFDGSLLLGVGGITPPDCRIRRTAVSTITIDNNGAGGATVVPATTNTGVIGTDALKWNRIRALSVVTGDLEMRDEERNAHWVFREETDQIVVTNKVTGKKYLLALKEMT